MTDMRLALNYAASSDRGLVRKNNEDSAYAGPRLIALADGMGGHAAGEVASSFLIESLRRLDSPLLDEPDHHGRLTTMLAGAVEEGNQHIASHVDENPQLQGMGCTLTALLFRKGEAGICHVGDSRAYLLRDGDLCQLTRDDTFVQSLVDEGKLDPADASSHPQRSLILKALTGRVVEPTLQTMEVRPGDRFMLCSDGLSDPVSFDTMLDVLSTGDPQRAASKLVEMALRGGGPDNVTVVVADIFDATGDSDDTDTLDNLPNQPVLVGAAGPESEVSDTTGWADTPASRAALSGASITNSWDAPLPEEENDTEEPAQGDAPANPSVSTLDNTGAETTDTDAGRTAGESGDEDAGEAGVPKKKTKNTASWIIGALVLVVVIGMIGGMIAGYKRVNDTYFVAVDQDQIVVKNGTQLSVLGMQINSTYQHVCLNEQAEVRLVSVGSDSAAGGPHPHTDCHFFSTADLNPSARSTIENMPEDSYQAIVEQINRLAEQTLPVCVTRAPGDNAKKKGSDNIRDSRRPSKRDAPEDLTTPGVSCREVK